METEVVILKKRRKHFQNNIDKIDEDKKRFIN